jgi:hypothetical protein
VRQDKLQGRPVFVRVLVVPVGGFQLFPELINGPEEATGTKVDALFREECGQNISAGSNWADREIRTVARQFTRVPKVRAAKVRVPKVRAAKVRAAKVRAVKVRAAKVRAAKVRAVKVRAAKVRAVKVRDVKVRAAKVRAVKVRAAKVRAVKVRAVKVRAAKVRAAKVRAAKVRGGQRNGNAVVFAFVAEKDFQGKAGFDFNFHGIDSE